MAGILAASQASTRPATPPYPDLSDPKAAAFSLAVALHNGDVKTARIVYVGKDKSFLEYLDALATAKANADQLQRATAARFGEWEKAFQPFQAEWEVPTGERGDAKISPQLAVPLAEVKEQGEVATLTLTQDVEIRLKKTDAGWKVTFWPNPSPLHFQFLKFSDAFSKELIAEIEQGKYKKAYELAAAAQRLCEKQWAELFKKLSPEDKGPKDNKK